MCTLNGLLQMAYAQGLSPFAIGYSRAGGHPAVLAAAENIHSPALFVLSDGKYQLKKHFSSLRDGVEYFKGFVEEV